MINDRGRTREPLNGLWNFSVDPYDSCLRQRWFEEASQSEDGSPLPVDYDFDRWEQVSVPSCWNLMSEKYFYYEGPAVYTRSFEYSGAGESRVLLKFGAVNYKASVFLNRRHVGTHYGGSTPFFADVTEFIREQNRIVIVADSTRSKSHVPSCNTDWFNYGGVYRDVELIRLPLDFIRDYFIRIQHGSRSSRIAFSVELNAPVQARVELRIPELGVEKQVMTGNGRGELVFSASPELWSPDNPKLYSVEIRYGTDVITDRIGFRDIRAVDGDIYLNNERILLKGICCHEEDPEFGKAVPEKEIIRNLEMAKELNCNYVRLAHYPHSERVAQLADELGIMLWEEIPVYWSIDFDDPRVYADAENQLAELILRDRNRASVIIWSVGNENPDTDSRFRFMDSLVQKAKSLDQTRPVSAACLVDPVFHRISDRLADSLDIIGVNEYYGWLNPNIELLTELFENSRPNKPVIVSEFGAAAAAGHRGKPSDLFSEECQLSVYEKQLQCMEGISYIRGMSPWILFDFRSPRRTNSHQKGFNRKGLLSEDKNRRKLAFDLLRRFYADWRIHGPVHRGSASR